MVMTVIMIIVGITLCAAAVAGIYYLIKKLIQYYSELKNGKTKRQAELEKMKIDDL